MSPRNRGRTVQAGAAEAKVRLNAARAFVSVAELVHAEPDDPVLPLRGVAAAVAILGGIAAADAICSVRLGEMFRGDDHMQAVDLLSRARPEGARVRGDFVRLLGIKDKVHYQAIIVTPDEAASAIRQARRMLSAAEEACSSA
jgi:hypothetical protein